MLEMLQDGHTYDEIRQNMDSTIMSKMKHLINIHVQNLTKLEKEYLTQLEVMTSNLHGLPKVHKSTVFMYAVKHTETDYVECQ